MTKLSREDVILRVESGAGESLKGADLAGLDLSKIYLREVNLREASLIGADLSETKLGGPIREKDVLDFNTRRAEAESGRHRTRHGRVKLPTNLIKADLRGADLRGTDLREAKLRNAIYDPEQLKDAINVDKAIL